MARCFAGTRTQVLFPEPSFKAKNGHESRIQVLQKQRLVNQSSLISPNWWSLGQWETVSQRRWVPFLRMTFKVLHTEEHTHKSTHAHTLLKGNRGWYFALEYLGLHTLVIPRFAIHRAIYYFLLALTHPSREFTTFWRASTWDTL